MNVIMSNILGAAIMGLVEMYMWYKFYDKKMKVNDFKFCLLFLILTSILILNFYIVNIFFRSLTVTLILIATNKLWFKKDCITSTITVLFGQAVIFLSECSYTVIISGIMNFDQSKVALFVKEEILITNVCITILAFLISNIKYLKTFYKYLISNTNKIKSTNVLYITLVFLAVSSILLGMIYSKVNILFLLLINCSLIIIYGFITYKNLDEKNRNAIYEAENHALMDSLHEYECMADRLHVENHENKNQLLALRGLINTGKKEALDYLDNLIKIKNNDSQKLLTKVRKIPSGGLQGIIYQKILIMDKEKIKYSLNITRDLKLIDFKKLDIKTNIDLCHVIGVFLDNAIEEVRNLEEGEKVVHIQFLLEEESLSIGISNTFGKVLELDKLDKAGYTNKGDSHGYGLTLVKELIKKNKRLSNEREVMGRFFTQKIKVSDMLLKDNKKDKSSKKKK